MNPCLRQALALPENIRLSWKDMPGTNTYFNLLIYLKDFVHKTTAYQHEAPVRYIPVGSSYNPQINDYSGKACQGQTLLLERLIGQ